MANKVCMESKKKNMTRRETEAPRGRQRACIVSKVWTSETKNIILKHQDTSLFTFHTSALIMDTARMLEMLTQEGTFIF